MPPFRVKLNFQTKMNIGHCNHLFLLEVKADVGLHIHGKAGLFAVAAGVGEDGGTIGPQFQRPGGVELVELVLIAGDTVNAQLPQQRPGDMTAAQLLTEGRALADLAFCKWNLSEESVIPIDISETTVIMLLVFTSIS